jgi:hypothetical protein
MYSKEDLSNLDQNVANGCKLLMNTAKSVKAINSTKLSFLKKIIHDILLLDKNKSDTYLRFFFFFNKSNLIIFIN